MGKAKAMSLGVFVKETEKGLADFEKKYRAKNKENPEHYPLSLSANNSGLWTEFFIEYITSGTV